MIRHIGRSQRLGSIGMILAGAPALAVFLLTYSRQYVLASLMALTTIGYVVSRSATHDRFHNPRDSELQRMGRVPSFVKPRGRSSVAAIAVLFGLLAWIICFYFLQDVDAKFTGAVILGYAAVSLGMIVVGGIGLLRRSQSDLTAGAKLARPLLDLPCVLYTDQPSLKRQLGDALLGHYRRQLVITLEPAARAGADTSVWDFSEGSPNDERSAECVLAAIGRTLQDAKATDSAHDPWTRGALIAFAEVRKHTDLDKAKRIERLQQDIEEGGSLIPLNCNRDNVLPRLRVTVETCMNADAALRKLLHAPDGTQTDDSVAPERLYLCPPDGAINSEIFLIAVLSVIDEWQLHEPRGSAGNAASVVVDTTGFTPAASKSAYEALAEALNRRLNDSDGQPIPSVTLAACVTGSNEGSTALLKLAECAQMVAHQTAVMAKHFEAAFVEDGVWASDSAGEGLNSHVLKSKPLVSNACLASLAKGRIWCVSPVADGDKPGYLRLKFAANGELCVTGIAQSPPEDQA